MFEQSSESEVHFDVEIAIKVLRQAGYHSHAVFLAEKHMHHEWYLKIQLEDIKVKAVKNKDPESKVAPHNFGSSPSIGWFSIRNTVRQAR